MPSHKIGTGATEAGAVTLLAMRATANFKFFFMEQSRSEAELLEFCG